MSENSTDLSSNESSNKNSMDSNYLPNISNFETIMEEHLVDLIEVPLEATANL